MKLSTIMLCLDQSLNITGWSIFQEQQYINSGTFKVSATKDIATRLNKIIQEIEKIRQDYNANFIVIEDIQQQASPTTYAKLAQVQGAILSYIAENDLEYLILSPSHWRKVIKDNEGVSFGRKRAEQKSAAKGFAEELINKKITEDEADAICIGVAAVYETKGNTSAF